MGHALFHLKRSDSDGKGVTRFIEYNDLRKRSMDYFKKYKLRYFIQKVSKKNDISCIIM